MLAINRYMRPVCLTWTRRIKWVVHYHLDLLYRTKDSLGKTQIQLEK
jgi:hypothetical protein